jgi:hypothetical protein
MQEDAESEGMDDFIHGSPLALLRLGSGYVRWVDCPFYCF